MLKAANVSIDRFFPLFAKTGVPVAFLVPTETGYEKSIMDATGPVRELLLDANIHNYSTQQQGPSAKKTLPAYFVTSAVLIRTDVSLYRPVTKQGDPRIWFYNLKKYCKPCDLLALIVLNNCIHVFNLSDESVSASLFEHGFAFSVLQEAAFKENEISIELLEKIRAIHNRGFIPSITPGDPGVGDTLEDALGIRRNNVALPDYKGIELKATRLTRNGKRRSKTRVNLFAKVPEFGMSYSEIVREYGRWKYLEDKKEDRLALENTTFASHPNSFGLILDVNENTDRLNMCHVDDTLTKKYLSHWLLSSLKEQLLVKHHETFWVQAQSNTVDGVEWFRYDKIIHTKKPNASLLPSLVEADKIMVDLAGYFTKQKDMKWRDHGMLFKMWPDDLPLLFGEPEEYIL